MPTSYDVIVRTDFWAQQAKFAASSSNFPGQHCLCTSTNQIGVCATGGDTIHFYRNNSAYNAPYYWGNGSTRSDILSGGARCIAYQPTSDQVVVGKASGGGIQFIGKNGSGLFGSGSPITTYASGSSNDFALYIPSTDQIAVCQQGAATLALISRTSGSGILDASSPNNAITGLTGVFAVAYCATSNQLALAMDTTRQVKFVDINPGTGLFDSGSTITTVDISNMSSGRVLGVAWCEVSNQVVATTHTNQTLEFWQINPGTSKFDASSTRTVRTISSRNLERVTYDPVSDRVISIPFSSAGPIVILSRVGSVFDSSATITEISAGWTTSGVTAIASTGVCAVSGNNFVLFFKPGKDGVALSVDLLTEIPVSYRASLPTDSIYLNDDSTLKVVLNTSLNYFNFSNFLDVCADKSLISYTRSEDTQSTLNQDLELTGGTAVTGDFTLTMGASTTLTLGTRSEYTEQIIIPSTGTILVRNDVTLSGFTLASGTQINKAPGVVGTVTVTLLSDPGVVPGTDVIIASPQPTLTLTNLISGSEVRIYDLDSATPGVLGTELAGIETLIGTTFDYEYEGSKVGDSVWIQAIATGYKEFGREYVLGANSATFPVDMEVETNI